MERSTLAQLLLKPVSYTSICFRDSLQTDTRNFAGHYRGEAYRCLQHYYVSVLSDPRVGVVPASVLYWMEQLRQIMEPGIHALDTDFTLPAKRATALSGRFFCRAFELFLRIHPYANGNGHIGRFLIWCILGRYGHWPRRWSVDPRPPDPPYSDFIFRYRNGDKGPT